MKYIDLYNDYNKELNKIKAEVAAYYEVKYDKNQKDIIYLQESKRKTNIFLLISMALVMVFFGFVYSFVNEYGKLVYLWYYAIIPALLYIIYVIWNVIIDIKLNKFKTNTNIIEDNLINNKYKEISNKVYELTVKIVCLNEYNDELIKLNDEELAAKWQEIVTLRRESIDRKLNYIVNVDTYTEYLENLINKNGER